MLTTSVRFLFRIFIAQLGFHNLMLDEFTNMTGWSSHTHTPGYSPNADGGEETASDDHPAPAALRWGRDPRHPPASLELLLLGECHRFSQWEGRLTSVSALSVTREAGGHKSSFVLLALNVQRISIGCQTAVTFLKLFRCFRLLLLFFLCPWGNTKSITDRKHEYQLHNRV